MDDLARRANWGLVLLFLSTAACGSLGVRPTPSATTAATQSSPTVTATASTTPRPSTSPMARTLAGVRLEMRPRDVIAVLGDPPKRDVAAGSGLAMWIYGPIGLEWGAQGNDAPLYSILVVPPFAGRTAEATIAMPCAVSTARTRSSRSQRPRCWSSTTSARASSRMWTPADVSPTSNCSWGTRGAKL